MAKELTGAQAILIVKRVGEMLAPYICETEPPVEPPEYKRFSVYWYGYSSESAHQGKCGVIFPKDFTE